MATNLGDVVTGYMANEKAGITVSVSFRESIPQYVIARADNARVKAFEVEGARELVRMTEEQLRDLHADRDNFDDDAEDRMQYARLAACDVLELKQAEAKEIEDLIWDAVSLWRGTRAELAAALDREMAPDSVMRRVPVVVELLTHEDEDGVDYRRAREFNQLRAARAQHDVLLAAEAQVAKVRTLRNQRIALAAQDGITMYAIAKALDLQPSSIRRLLPGVKIPQ